MDYRGISPARLTWCESKVWYGAGKLQFQTPPAAYTVTISHRIGVGGRDVVLRGFSQSFRSFLHSIEASAHTQLHRDLAGLQLRECISWSGEMRLTLYENETMWFQEDGDLYAHTPSEQEGVCACIVEIVGLWKSAASWGLKIVLREMKDVSCTKLGSRHTNGWAFRDD